MKTVVVNLSPEIKTLELVCISDSHIGDPYANEQALMKQIRYVEETPNCYAIINGDIMNNGIKSSKSDTYTEVLSPMEQVVKAVLTLKPIANKVLAITQGNHERSLIRWQCQVLFKYSCLVSAVVSKIQSTESPQQLPHPLCCEFCTEP